MSDEIVIKRFRRPRKWPRRVVFGAVLPLTGIFAGFVTHSALKARAEAVDIFLEAGEEAMLFETDAEHKKFLGCVQLYSWKHATLRNMHKAVALGVKKFCEKICEDPSSPPRVLKIEVPANNNEWQLKLYGRSIDYCKGPA